jgi:hypothetical protein
MTETRLIVYHKHPSSARTLFLNLKGTVCLFEGVPESSEVTVPSPEMETAAAQSLITATEARLGLASGSLEMEGEFVAEVDNEQEHISTYLARLTSLDAPLDAVAQADGSLISITEARGLPSAELNLLRLAYSFIME